MSEDTHDRDLEAEKLKLTNERSMLGLSKREHETKLIAIKNLIRTGGFMPHEKYKKCCDSQQKHSRAILHIEKQMAPIKKRLREIEEIESRFQIANGQPVTHESPVASSESPLKKTVVELVALRQNYQDFAADGTRIASMRQMAAEFVLKLNPIIKRALGSD